MMERERFIKGLEIHERKKSRKLFGRDFEENGDTEVHKGLGRKTETQIEGET
jgi:hypothetical protein